MTAALLLIPKHHIWHLTLTGTVFCVITFTFDSILFNFQSIFQTWYFNINGRSELSPTAVYLTALLIHKIKILHKTLNHNTQLNVKPFCPRRLSAECSHGHVSDVCELFIALPNNDFFPSKLLTWFHFIKRSNDPTSQQESRIKRKKFQTWSTFVFSSFFFH